MSQKLRSLLVVVFSLGLLSAVAAWQSGGARNDLPKERVAALQSTGPAWWKGNLHTHSLWSDGDDFPEMIADWYKRHGYHFLTLSEHNVIADADRWIDVKTAKTDRSVAMTKYLARYGAAWVEQREKKEKEQVRLKPLREFRSVLEEPGRFLMIPGEEITHKFAKNPVHMNAVNLRDPIQPIDGPSVAETVTVNLRLVAEQRKKSGWQTLAFLNHPNFGWGVNAEDMLSEELRFFEVFNGHPGVKNYGDETHASTERMWDILLALRLGRHKLPVVYGLGTDDAHAYHVYGAGKTNPGRGWIMVKAPFLTGETIVRAMQAGDFYASSGVTFTNVVATKEQLSLVIKSEPGVKYKTQFFATMRGAPMESEAVLDKDGKALPVTRTYSPEVGKVVAESDALEPSYPLTGKELYVRARVVSTKAHPNPYQKGDVEMAWTQPVTP